METKKRKPFADRSLTSSRVRTGKTGRKSPRRRSDRAVTQSVRTHQTTGQIDFETVEIDENVSHKVKIFTPVS